MSDLIRREEVIELLNDWIGGDVTKETIIGWIRDDIPTAYDVNKLLEEIYNLPHGEYSDEFGKGYSLAINICIGILKGE